MYEIRKYIDKFETYRLGSKNSDTYFEVVPQRGGIITNFFFNGKQVLYLDKKTLYDTTKNIRGGIPVLFPICGWLQDGTYHVNNKAYNLPQHGLARINSWKVVDSFIGNDSADITLLFSSDEETLKSYPYNFRLIFRYELYDNQLVIHQTYINDSNKIMPFYAGFHPYFHVKDKISIFFDTDANLCWDSIEGKEKAFNKIQNFNEPEVNLILLNTSKNSISFKSNDSLNITLTYDNSFKYVVLWTLKDKDFVCVEPWMARPNSLNTNEDVFYLKPHNTLNINFSIKIE